MLEVDKVRDSSVSKGLIVTEGKQDQSLGYSLTSECTRLYRDLCW